MGLPFTHAEFLDLFAAYNRVFWPMAAAVWVITLLAVLGLLRRRPRADRTLLAALSAQWFWSGLVYHMLFFRRINSAAIVFGLLFTAQGALLLWRGVLRPSAAFEAKGVWGAVGWGLVIYSFVYPAVVLLSGLSYPRMPLYAVPCPTMLLTAGLLLFMPQAEVRRLGVIPIAWAGIGGSAAFMLGIRADLALIAAGALLIVRIILPERKAALVLPVPR